MNKYKKYTYVYILQLIEYFDLRKKSVINFLECTDFRHLYKMRQHALIVYIIIVLLSLARWDSSE